MRSLAYSAIIFFVASLVFTSCQKLDTALPVPSKGTAYIAQVAMGEEYEEQVFYNFEQKKIVMKSSIDDWDLAFEAQPDGKHIFMNGGKNVFLYNTHLTNPASVSHAMTEAITTSQWGFDAPCGLPDSTYVADWETSSGQSKNEVYIAKIGRDVYKKLVIASQNEQGYILKYGDIDAPVLHSIEIPKDPAYDYSYFSFSDNGKVVKMEPPRDSWDIVFTRYRYIYYELNNFPYSVTGVLLNPYRTFAIADSLTGFAGISYARLTEAFSSARDVIGFDWKNYDFDKGRYITNPAKCYVVKTQKDHFYRLHFINFYDSNGIKGSPSFEFERIH